MEALVTLIELQDRLEWDLDPGEQKVASGALEDLSDDARLYGSRLWETPALAPRQVKNLVLRAAARYMRNFEGLTQSRAGDETVAMPDRGEDAGSPVFTKKEIQTLRAIAGNIYTGFYSVGTVGYGSPDRPLRGDSTGSVPVAGHDGEKPFPLYATEEPW